MKTPLPNIVVIILTLNQQETTLACLTSLLAVPELPFRVLVWDNASQDGTVEAIQTAFPEVLAHHHPTNLGVAGGRNEAAQLAIETFQPDYLLFLDNDMLFEPGFVQALWQPFTEDTQVGQTQAKLRFMHDQTRLNDGGGAQINFLTWQITPVGYNEIDQGQYDTRKKCIACGGAMMVRTDVFQQLDGFDMTFNPFGPEDLDFSLRLQKAGYSAWYIPQAVAYHVVSHTFGKGYSEDYARHKSRHWFAFMRRHASLSQKAAFFLFGAPSMVVRVILREVGKGNLAAIRGLMWGVFDFLKSAVVAKKQG
jgi:GT2 family glycosyltransferase